MRTLDLLAVLNRTLEPSFKEYAERKERVRVTFLSGKTKWGWIHYYQGRWYLTRGNRVGFSLDNAVKVEPMKGRGL
jgi:hypothetical protein